MGALDGKVAVVTGSSTGIGEAIAATFVREGARVVAVGRTTTVLEWPAAVTGTAAMVAQCCG